MSRRHDHGMDYPSLDELLKVVENRYTLVTIAAKRARQITDGARVRIELDAGKPVTLALLEILRGKVPIPS